MFTSEYRFLIFQREINDTVQSIFDSVKSLKNILKGNFRSILQLKELSKARLDQLKHVTLAAEEEYNEIIGTFLFFFVVEFDTAHNT